jgi:hypothetical protein
MLCDRKALASLVGVLPRGSNVAGDIVSQVRPFLASRFGLQVGGFGAGMV